MLYDEAAKSQYCPRLTGIPPHIALINQVEALKAAVEQSEIRLGDVIRTELNARGVGGEVFQANSILDAVHDVHSAMLETLRTYRPPSGAATDTGTNETGLDGAVRRSGTVIEAEEGYVKRQWYMWGGNLHNVPEGFTMPTMNLHTLIVNWFVGSKHPLIPPLKFARADDFPKVKSMKCTLSKMRKYMKAVIRAANKVGIEVGVDGKLIKSVAKANLVYERVHKLFEYNHPQFKR